MLDPDVTRLVTPQKIIDGTNSILLFEEEEESQVDEIEKLKERQREISKKIADKLKNGVVEKEKTVSTTVYQ